MSLDNKLSLAYNIILLLVLSILYLGRKVAKLSSEQHLRDHIIWVRDNSRYLYSFVDSWQDKLSIPSRYRINGECEVIHLKEILSLFSSFIVEKYFAKELLPIRSFYVVSGEHFFAWMLRIYLKQFSLENKIGENNMHEKQVSQRRYGERLSDDFDATYSLTPFGIVYYKLYYICFLFLGQSTVFNNRGKLFQESDAAFIKEVLDTSTISIRYRQHF